MATAEEKWQALWKAEKTTCTEYTGHRAIMDWAGYGSAQEERRKAAWHWLSDRLQALRDGEYPSDDAEITRLRIDYIDAVINEGYQAYWWHVPDYPRDYGTDDESCKIKERAYYCSFFGEGKPPELSVSRATATPRPWRRRHRRQLPVARRPAVVDCRLRRRRH
jgi:hypothetical protein